MGLTSRDHGMLRTYNATIRKLSYYLLQIKVISNLLFRLSLPPFSLLGTLSCPQWEVSTKPNL
ncbi:hypothetical protein AHAS_Ahas07G0142800 [Arachis hypogaea]